MKRRWLAVPTVLALLTALAGCSVFQFPNRVDTLSDRISEAAAADTAETDFDLQSRCAAAARRFYTGMSVPAGRTRAGFSSNYNPAMGRCFMTYTLTGSGSGGVFHETTIVDPVRRFVEGECMLADQPAGSGAVKCWVWWHGKRVRDLSPARFRGYEGRFMASATSPAHG